MRFIFSVLCAQTCVQIKLMYCAKLLFLFFFFSIARGTTQLIFLSQTNFRVSFSIYPLYCFASNGTGDRSVCRFAPVRARAKWLFSGQCSPIKNPIPAKEQGIIQTRESRMSLFPEFSNRYYKKKQKKQ